MAPWPLRHLTPRNTCSPVTSSLTLLPKSSNHHDVPLTCTSHHHDALDKQTLPSNRVDFPSHPVPLALTGARCPLTVVRSTPCFASSRPRQIYALHPFTRPGQIAKYPCPSLPSQISHLSGNKLNITSLFPLPLLHITTMLTLARLASLPLRIRLPSTTASQVLSPIGTTRILLTYPVLSRNASSTTSTTDAADMSDKNPGNVIGGHKANINNPSASVKHQTSFKFR